MVTIILYSVTYYQEENSPLQHFIGTQNYSLNVNTEEKQKLL